MINRIIDLSARNRFLVLLLVGAAALAGWWALRTIPLDAIPRAWCEGKARYAGDGSEEKMINRIIDLSARNRFLVLLLVGAAALAGWWALRTIPLDAIPDLSDTQVIIYSRWDRSPDIMEDQVTYPIVSAM